MSLIINDAATVTVIRDLLAEIEANLHRNYPMSHLRRTALVTEENGEAMREALDVTRLPYDEIPRRYTQSPALGRLRSETLHTAVMAVRQLIEMEKENAR